MDATGEMHMSESILDLKGTVVPESLAEKVFGLLIDAIERGELAPGTRIREAALARELNISRGPLREALRRLEGRKLLQYTPNLGMRVATLSLKDIVEIFQMREALEGMACRLATENMTDAEIDELAELLKLHRGNKELRQGAAYYQRAGDLDIHYRIAVGSRNERLVELLCKDLYHYVRVHRYRSSEAPGRAGRALAEHEAIIKAMRARDPDLAERLMRAHIHRALENLKQKLAAEPAAADSPKAESGKLRLAGS